MGKIEYLNIPTMVVALLVLATIAIVLNSLSIYIIFTSKQLMKRNSTLILLNLLIVHLCQGIFVLPFYAGKKIKQDLLPAQVFANGFRLTYMLTFYGACLGILLVAVDRVLATFLLTRYKIIVTRKRVKIALVVFWVYVVGLCMIPFVDTEGSILKPKFDPIANRTDPIANRTDPIANRTDPIANRTVTYDEKPEEKFYVYNQQPQWVMFMLIVNTAAPYVVVVLCYTYIACKLTRLQSYQAVSPSGKRSKYAVEQLKQESEEARPLKKKDIEKHKQVTKLTFILTVIYGIFWTPSIIYYPLKEDCKSCFPDNYEDSELEQYLGFITKYLAFLDAAAAPMVYCFMHREFQKSLERIKSKLLRLPLPEKEQSVSSNETTMLH